MEDLNGFNDLIESNAYFMFAFWRATLCNSLLPKISHKAMVQLEILIDRDEYFTFNIDFVTGPNRAI